MLDSKTLNSKIGAVRRSTASLRENIQEILCNAAGHAYEHGDVTFFTRLFDATGGLNRKLIAEWVRDFGFAALQKDGSFKLNKQARNEADFSDGDAVADYLMDQSRPWYAKEANASDIVKELDVAKRIEALAKAVTKAANEDNPIVAKGDAMQLAMGKLRKALEGVQEKRARANTKSETREEANARMIAERGMAPAVGEIADAS